LGKRHRLIPRKEDRQQIRHEFPLEAALIFAKFR
jgi:hypothetical protein